MANQEHLDILKTNIKGWNEWRTNNPFTIPDLRNADLRGMQLYVDPYKAEDPDLSRTIDYPLSGLDFRATDFSGADLRGAHIDSADLKAANLEDASLAGAFLWNNNFSDANLRHTDFSKAFSRRNLLGGNDLSETKGLDAVRHLGPSVIGIDTLYMSAGRIPEAFLRGCGVPDSFINYVPSLVGGQQAIQFYSCFISYSHKDEGFARRLHSRMQSDHLRVWFAPEDMKGGKKVRDQIDQAIQFHDRLLLVLSKDSMESDWVKSEIRKARRVEVEEKRQKLFPIRLIDFETLRAWECFDSDSGKDLAVEVREYFIPDFSAWMNHAAFEAAFDRLLQDLRAAEGPAKLKHD